MPSKAEIKKMRDEFKKTGELPDHLKKLVKGKKDFEKRFKVKDVVIPGMEWMSKLGEERDYKAEYKKFQSSTKSKKYRAELNKYNRKKGTYGNGDGKDASHKGGKIVGFESESKNRGRAEKSRLKKEDVYEAKNTPEIFEKYRTILVVAFRKAGILVKKIKPMKKGFTNAAFGVFFDVKAANGSDTIPIYIDKKGMVELGVSSKGFVIGRIDQMAKMIKNLKDFKKSDLDESVNEAKYKGYDWKKQNRKDGHPLIVPALQKTFVNMKDLKKYIDKHGTMESVKEAKDPDVIAQIRGVLKKGYSAVKDPVSGKKMKMDTYTASAITQVYDAINTSNKKKFSKLSILKMQNVAFKVIKK